MNIPRKLTLACFLACAFTAVAQAQTSTTLQVGIPIEREMGPRDSHKFKIDVEANSRLQLIVEQKGIDVVISVAAPDGNVIGDYDTPNGSTGPENVSFVTLTAGTYSITVEPLDEANTSKGRYEIKVVEIRKATEQEQRARQNRETARTKSIELLRDLESSISQVRTPATRIKARIKAADLLWEIDEKRASKYIADATTDLKELIASLNEADWDVNLMYPVIWQLRYEMIQLLVGIDPEKALNLLYATAPPAGPYNNSEQSSQESSLELTIASHIMDRDPQRSLQLARQSLKQGYASQLSSTVNDLRTRDPKLATELANEIINKLLTEKLAQNNDAGQLALNLLSGTYVQGSSITIGEKPASVVPDEKSKELLQKILGETLNFPATGPHAIYQAPAQWQLLNRLRSMGAEVDKIIPGSAAAVEKKFSELSAGLITPMVMPQLGNGTIEDSLQNIENSPAEMRDQLYYQLANSEASKGEIKRAKQIINEHVKTPWQRRDWLKQIDQQELSQTVTNGKFEDALRVIGNLRPFERANYLSLLINRIQTDPKPANAVNLLEQARALLPLSPVAEDEQQMNALFEIASAFSEYDSRRSFEIVEPLVDQFNEICAAARVLQGFGGDFFLGDELSEDGNSLSTTGNQMTAVIGRLALANFERAKSTSDRIRLPELRLKAYLDIAQQALEGEQN